MWNLIEEGLREQALTLGLLEPDIVEMLPTGVDPVEAFRQAKSQGHVLLERDNQYAIAIRKIPGWRLMMLYGREVEPCETTRNFELMA